ncbi:MAG: hypothetical protein PHS73_03535 [Candidatus Peribacteraceae bacterium]|nr:hypothetical protein [Candidatus Peribacteraceae bacterium]
MECPSPRRKHRLSQEGEQRRQLADEVHQAVWTHCFEGRNAISRMAPDRKRAVHFKCPSREQILDFVEGQIEQNGKRLLRVILPSADMQEGPYGMTYEGAISWDVPFASAGE